MTRSFLLFCTAGLAAAALRDTVSLNENWRFERQAAPGSAVEWPFRNAESPAYDDSRWQRVFLPHSWDQTAHMAWVRTAHWRGIGWYRRHFAVPASTAGRRISLEFEGASQVARIWVNGREACEHTGGYTGFVCDVTALVKPGADNLLAARVDDTNSPDLPPANETNIATYGGLYRDVWLHITGPVHVPYRGISITTPEVSAGRSTVRVATEVRNKLGVPVRVKLVSEVVAKSGQTVGRAERDAEIAAGRTAIIEQPGIAVTGASLWHPNHPNLYTLRSRIYRAGTAVDEVSTRFGFRVMGYVAGKGYTINGEFINIHGVNRRQDYGFLVDAVPDAISRRDMEIIKEMGANFVRTAHYVQDKSILEAADELGLLVWEEIPNIKIYDYSPEGPTENGDSRYTRRYIDDCLRAMEQPAPPSGLPLAMEQTQRIEPSA